MGIIYFILSLVVHEYAHAITADKLGDNTPRQYGRVTLNPLSHLDPFGLLLMIFAGFGFAKPVPINPYKLGRWGSMWVAAAGPISNIIIAILCALLIKSIIVFNIPRVYAETILSVLAGMLQVNILLAVFNLLPIPLLDGSRIVGALIPSLGKSLQEFEMQPYSSLLLMGFIYIMRNPIGSFTSSVVDFVVNLI